MVKVLLLCDSYKLAYRVMRCAALAGARVHVMGTARGLGLRHSRFCRSFDIVGDFAGGEAGAVVGAMNHVIARREIDLVIAGEAAATRLLIAQRERISAPISASPDLATFDLLNDKWAFTSLMGELGADCPASWRFERREALHDAWQAGDLPDPAIAKPLSRSGGQGVLKLTGNTFASAYAAIDYAPIIVQPLVQGLEIAATIYCRDGEVARFVAYRRERGVYDVLDSPAVERQTRVLARRLNLNGIYNFDLIANETLTHFQWLECNPRVFFSIDVLALAGVNFLALAMGFRDPARTVTGRRIKRPKALVRDLLRPWTLRPGDGALTRFLLADPTPFAREALGRERT